MLPNEIGDLKFPNCIIASSGSPLSKGNKYAIKPAIKAGVGGVVSKSISSEGGNGYGRNSIKELTDFGLPSSFLVTGQWQAEVLNLYSGRKAIRLIKEARGANKNIPIIASILERDLNPDKWALTAANIERFTDGVDGIEVNLGKSVPKHYKNMESKLMDQDIDIDEKLHGLQKLDEQCCKKHIEIVKEIKQRVSKPIFAKLGHGARYNEFIAEALSKERIPIVGLNAPKAETFLDPVAPFKPIHPGVQGYKRGIISGSVLFESHLTFNVEILKKTGYSAEIIHSGGVVAPELTIQALIKGMQLVGVCTILFVKGSEIIKDIDISISKFARELGVTHIKDLHDRFRHTQTILDEYEDFKIASPILDAQRCSSCGRCSEVCPDGYIRRKRDRVSFRQYCQGCGACVRVCKNEAIRLSFS